MNRKICRQETRVELNFLTTDTVTKEDLVPSKNLKSLGNLYLSLVSPPFCPKSGLTLTRVPRNGSCSDLQI
jgi:hypothetical protein